MSKLVSAQEWSDRRWRYRLANLYERIDESAYRSNPTNCHHQGYLKMCDRLLLVMLTVFALGLFTYVYGATTVGMTILNLAVGVVFTLIIAWAVAVTCLTLFAWVTVKDD